MWGKGGAGGPARLIQHAECQKRVKFEERQKVRADGRAAVHEGGR